MRSYPQPGPVFSMRPMIDLPCTGLAMASSGTARRRGQGRPMAGEAGPLTPTVGRGLPAHNGSDPGRQPGLTCEHRVTCTLTVGLRDLKSRLLDPKPPQGVQASVPGTASATTARRPRTAAE